MALITCPSCGANVSDKAIKCPKCGTLLIAEAPETSEDSTGNVSTRSGETLGKILIAVILTIALIFIFAIINSGRSERNNSYGYADSCAVDTMKADSIAPEPIVYTRYDIHDMHVLQKENPLRAKEKYLDKHAEITGRLKDIRDDYFVIEAQGTYLVSAPTVHCSISDGAIKKRLMDYNIGDPIMIKGKIDEVYESSGYHIVTAEIGDKSIAKAEELKKYKGRWLEVYYDNAAAEDVKTDDRGIRLVLRRNGTLSYVSVLDMRMVQIGRSHVNRGEGKWKIKTINGSPCIELTRNANTTYIKDGKLYNKEWHYLGDIVDAGSEKDADESSYFKKESSESSKESAREKSAARSEQNNQHKNPWGNRNSWVESKSQTTTRKPSQSSFD